ncbi:DEAD/DEAH box helicase family protein [Tritrichomonas foetus]|uniref:DEAD/DEAH box helicase family protein n=1 Tax=Tritrichomonas foetus TaxID=1144522 RepID=A0A1J4JVM0_9EUKA|nr:DEAD/DEAH box helicase family protein [Tritrichomonas foetus]|eukprot:OHT01325.1 DEAD/DEAH box helicase family protein [Tritrichomonas foetus]
MDLSNLNNINSDPSIHDDDNNEYSVSTKYTSDFNLTIRPFEGHNRGKSRSPTNRKFKIYYPKKPSQYQEPNILKTTQEMTDLGVPDFLQHAYLSGMPNPIISQLREWQISLLKTPGWNEGRSAIVLVPTSGGKTVAADISIAQLLNQDPTAKAIYALPFVALANEKFNEFTKRFYKFSVRAYYQNVGGPDFSRGNIAVCTYEKAHSIINAALLGKYADKIKLVIIDEIHMIGEDFRGPVIEALIVKLLLMNHSPRIIGLTATINQYDASLLADWINGFSFISEVRPSQVKQFVVKSNGDLFMMKKGEIGNKIASLAKIENDVNFVLDPIRRLLSKSPESTILIFVNRRSDTISLGEFISTKLHDSKIQNLPKLRPPSEFLLQKRRNLVQDLARASGFVDDAMKKCIINGIGIHHAGLLLEERRLIETAAREKTISIIVATTTLSAGVNIHSVARVFIMNVFRYSPGGQIAIPAAQYTQMVGRAGRTAQRAGEAFIFAHSTTDAEIRLIQQLSKHEISNITPHLRDPGAVERFFLQCLATRLVQPNDGLDIFMNKTYKFNSDDPKIALSIENARERLINMKLINSKSLAPTPLGRAISGSSLNIDEGLVLYETVQKVQNDLCLTDEVHLLYLCVSPQIASLIHPEPYNSTRWNYILNKHRHVIQLITGMDDRSYDRIQDLPNIYGGLGRINSRIDEDMDRIFVSVILRELINETPVSEITRKFKIERGTIQSLQMQSATFAGQTSKFCEIIGSGLLATTLNRFRQRLNFAARTELLGLMVLPSINKETARMLVDVGISSPIELAELNVEGIAALITAKDEGDDSPKAPTEREITIAGLILKDAHEYTESFTKLEILEEAAVQNITE